MATLPHNESTENPNLDIKTRWLANFGALVILRGAFWTCRFCAIPNRGMVHIIIVAVGEGVAVGVWVPQGATPFFIFSQFCGLQPWDFDHIF